MRMPCRKAEGRKQKAEGRKQKAGSRRQSPQASFCLLPSAYCLLPSAFCFLLSVRAGVPEEPGDLGIAFGGGFESGPPVLVSDARIRAAGKQGPHDISAAL